MITARMRKKCWPCSGFVKKSAQFAIVSCANKRDAKNAFFDELAHEEVSACDMLHIGVMLRVVGHIYA